LNLCGNHAQGNVQGRAQRSARLAKTDSRGLQAVIDMHGAQRQSAQSPA
jgi:hypothetical protein